MLLTILDANSRQNLKIYEEEICSPTIIIHLAKCICVILKAHNHLFSPIV